MEGEFEDFLNIENMEPSDQKNNFKDFQDIKYNFFFNHEAEKSYKDEFSIIKEKYNHRITNFFHKIQQPTCFVRAIKDNSEIEFIKQNRNRIINIVKKNNENNIIVFIALKSMKADIDFPVYYVDLINYSTASRLDLRNLFDSNHKLIEFLTSLVNESKNNRNLIFDLKKEVRYLDVYKQRYDSLIKVLNFDIKKINIQNNVVIYGVGNVGKVFYNKIKDYYKVIYFIDKYSDDEMYDNIKILTLDNCNILENCTIIVTATYYFDEIKVSLLQKLNNEIAIKSLNEYF
ncbi:MAG: hypothetical protein PHY47_09825 [Lachnospiraceae bacterium]|nr:hypothetical protein [Lachnospiraceae bacterium]